MTAKDGSASEEQGWDLNLGLLALTLSFSQLLPAFNVTTVTSKAKVRILEFITEETGLWNWPLALAVGIWNWVRIWCCIVPSRNGVGWNGMVMRALLVPEGPLPLLPTSRNGWPPSLSPLLITKSCFLLMQVAEPRAVRAVPWPPKLLLSTWNMSGSFPRSPFQGQRGWIPACISLLWYLMCICSFPMSTPHGLRNWVPRLPESQAVHGPLRPYPRRSLEDAANKTHQKAVVGPGTQCADPAHHRGVGARPGAPPKLGTIIWVHWRTLFILKTVVTPFRSLSQGGSGFILWRRRLKWAGTQVRIDFFLLLLSQKIKIKRLAQGKLDSHIDLCIYPLEKCH